MDTVTITGGKFGGRKISTPGGATHPMGSRERLALFNMLTGEISGASILDAFSGSGALGIEALSRDAVSVTFVDNSAKAIQTIHENLKNLGVNDGFKVVKGAIPGVVGDLGDFDVVLADPPYDAFNVADIEGLVRVIRGGGILVLSHPGEAPVFDDLVLEKSRSYAGATISIYRKKA